MPANTESSSVWFIPGYSTGLGQALAQAVLKRVRDKLDKFSDSLRQWETVTVGADFPEA